MSHPPAQYPYPDHQAVYSPLPRARSHGRSLDSPPPSLHNSPTESHGLSSTPHHESPHHESPIQVEDLQANPGYNPYDGFDEPPPPRFIGRTSLVPEFGAPEIRSDSPLSHMARPSYEASSVYHLNPPGPRHFYDKDNTSSFFAGSEQALPLSTVGHSRYLKGKRASYAPPPAKSRRTWIVLASLGVLLLIVLAVGLPLVLRLKPGKQPVTAAIIPTATASATTATPTGNGKPKANFAITGSDGSQILLEDGTTYTYKNPFGGYWYSDPNDPFNNGARAQSWTPALNETFRYGIDKIRGVNLGGWLTTEPFITPALYEKYLGNTPPAVDEWLLSEAMAADVASGGLNQLENHYKTFITEQDFAEIAAAGLNYVRIPLPYWAIETRTGEPFLPKTAWTYFLKAIQWARKYGIRINLDLHALPGSQNGWNHSGRFGSINLLNGPMGIANAQRSLDYMRIITEFISQPQYKDVVTMFGIINEPLGPTIGMDALQRYYLEAYDMIRGVTGTGEGNGPMIAIHDGFMKPPNWAGYLPNADRLSLDYHPYICFDAQSDAAIATYKNTPCTTWGSVMNTSMSAFGLTVAGEYSLAVTDCGLWLNGVNLGSRYEGTYNNFPRVGDCTKWTDWQNYDQAMKDGLRDFALASMDALQNWFFWNWKIGPSMRTGKVETPAWSYKLGLDNGWIPADPREAAGSCAPTAPFVPPLRSWQTGGPGAGQIPVSVSAALAWPPARISHAPPVSALPTYTPTGPVPTLPGPSLTFAGATPTRSVDVGNGWANPADTAGVMVPAVGCVYLDPWVGSADPPSPLCPTAARGRLRETPLTTPLPLTTPPPSASAT